MSTAPWTDLEGHVPELTVSLEKQQGEEEEVHIMFL